MQNFKDESFVGQYLSPQLMRDMRLFSIHDDASERELLVSAIHDDDGYRTLRQTLSQQYDLGAREPNIQRSEEHTSELQSPDHLVCRLLLEKKKKTKRKSMSSHDADDYELRVQPSR